jgi:hypothetical protein
MVSLKKNLSIVLVVLALIGLVAGLVFTTRYANSIRQIATVRNKLVPTQPYSVLSEIHSLEQDLRGNLDDETRESLEAKLDILYREATRQAMSIGNLTSTPASQITFVPPTFAFGGQRDTGIIENPSVPFSSMDFKINNAWQELVGGNYILVFAGSLANRPDQGVLLVESETSGGSGEYLTPRKNGSVRIVKAQGMRLVLETPTHDIFYFDVPARRFVNTLDEIIATTTPLVVASPTPGTLIPARTPTPTPIVLDNGWYLYADPDGEFSFAYPSTALVRAGQNSVDSSKNVSIQFNLPDKPYQGMSIRLEPNPKRLQGTDIAIRLFEESAQKPVNAEFISSLQPISVGGVPAVQAYIPSTNTEVTVIIPYDGKIFIVSPVHDTAMVKVEAEVLEVFYHILGTFTFKASK